MRAKASDANMSCSGNSGKRRAAAEAAPRSEGEVARVALEGQVDDLDRLVVVGDGTAPERDGVLRRVVRPAVAVEGGARARRSAEELGLRDLDAVDERADRRLVGNRPQLEGREQAVQQLAEIDQVLREIGRDAVV